LLHKSDVIPNRAESPAGNLFFGERTTRVPRPYLRTRGGDRAGIDLEAETPTDEMAAFAGTEAAPHFAIFEAMGT